VFAFSTVFTIIRNHLTIFVFGSFHTIFTVINCWGFSSDFTVIVLTSITSSSLVGNQAVFEETEFLVIRGFVSVKTSIALRNSSGRRTLKHEALTVSVHCGIHLDTFFLGSSGIFDNGHRFPIRISCLTDLALGSVVRDGITVGD